MESNTHIYLNVLKFKTILKSKKTIYFILLRCQHFLQSQNSSIKKSRRVALKSIIKEKLLNQ